MRIVVTEFMDEAALEGVAADILYDPSLVDDRPLLLASLSDADAVIVRNRTQVDAALLAAAPRLRAVGRLGVGLDNIDLAACEARGVAVLPATGANTLSVVEYVIGAALALVRGAFSSTAAILAGEWPRGSLGQGGEVAGRTLGLIGYGAISRAVEERATALGLRTVWSDPMVEGGLKLDALLVEADIVSLHVPLSEGTRGMIDTAALARMKPDAVLINTARGGVVDEAALAAALKEGRLGGAALDVFETEPLTREAAAKFEGCPNLILTPHVAGMTAEGNVRVSGVTVANVMRVLGE